MSKPGPKTSRKWHPQQEELLLKLLSMPEFNPIGGEGDGVMERMDHAPFVQLNANLTTSAWYYTVTRYLRVGDTPISA
jgi:hypothetical protein